MATNPVQRENASSMASDRGKSLSIVSSEISPEARALLEAALAQKNGRTFNEVLASIPNVGEDADFERHRG
ncbi:hypothetical protein ACOBR2_20255 [Telmatobacter bradus]|uniref:hypothetical protein n=1 Tax=Telmatobacter bradus TaxID=474953 RepID=UPI003B43A4FD